MQLTMQKWHWTLFPLCFLSTHCLHSEGARNQVILELLYIPLLSFKNITNALCFLFYPMGSINNICDIFSIYGNHSKCIIHKKNSMNSFSLTISWLKKGIGKWINPTTLKEKTIINKLNQNKDNKVQIKVVPHTHYLTFFLLPVDFVGNYIKSWG